MFTHYGDMKGNVKCSNWGGLGVRSHPRTPAMRYSTYNFLFHFNRSYASILYCFWVIASYLSKVTYFIPPHLHLVPPLRVTLFKFRWVLWHQKTRVPMLSCSVAFTILRVTILRQYRHVTDKWMLTQW